MPYGISNNQDGCAGWATVKQETDGSYTTVKCYVSKQDAIDRMVAQSLAEKIDPLGEVGKRNSQAGRFVICDIDDTLLSSGVRPMQKNIDALNFMADKFNIVLVTGRIESQREATVKALKDAGVKYDRLVMKQDAKQDTAEYKKEAAKRLQIAKPVNVAIDNDEKARQEYSSLGIHTISPSELKEPRHMTPVGACIVEAVMTDLRDMPMMSDAPMMDAAPELPEAGEAVEPVITPEMLVEELRSLVASTVSMYFQAHGSHWNVRGQDFAQYHALFQEIYEDVYSAIDPTAEMVRKLDGEAPFELQELVSLRKVNEQITPDSPSDLASALLLSNEQMLECLNCAYEYADELDEQGVANFIAERLDMHRKWGWQLKASLDVSSQRSSKPHWAIRSIDDKRSYAYTNLEVRASEDGKTLVGYASMWDTPSEPMPFTEYVKRGAFTKTLKDGADVRLLIDHEGVPLARTKSGTLKLAEDDRGLRVEATLDPLNPDAARVISAMKRGDLSQMSFAFRTIKDSWSADRMTRELREVQLFDVSIVTFPAYEQTVAELRTKKDDVTVAPTTGVLLRKSQIELQKYRSR